MRVVSEAGARAGPPRAAGPGAAGRGQRQSRHPAERCSSRWSARWSAIACSCSPPRRRSPRRDGVILETPFVGPGMRDAGERLDYLPMRLSLVPRLFATIRPPDVVLLHTSTPREGKVSLGIEVNILPAAIEAVRARGGLVIAQLNPRMPYTLGDSELAEDLIDLAIEVEEDLASPAVGDVTRARRADRRVRGEPRRRRLDAAAGHRPGPRRDAARPLRAGGTSRSGRR